MASGKLATSAVRGAPESTSREEDPQVSTSTIITNTPRQNRQENGGQKNKLWWDDFEW
jgi:hypothetical protein